MEKITCPNCGHIFDIEDVVARQIEERIKEDYAKKLNEQLDKMKKEKEKIELEKKQIAEEKDKMDELVNKKLAEELQKKEKRLTKELEEKYLLQIQSLEDENEKRKKENLKLQKRELELMKKEKELENKEEELKLKLEKEFLEKQKEITEKAVEKEREQMKLKEKEWEKRFEDQKKLMEQMKRKAEQGSMQMQGEILELAVEDLLKSLYPFDKIEEVKKGMKGADVIQRIFNRFQQESGKIVYEVKRTKSFNKDWLDKLKNDKLSAKADLAVLITQVLPDDIKDFGEKDGVWICDFKNLRSLSLVLRNMLIKIHSVKKTQENKGEKQEMLYRYFTSSEFVETIKRIVENLIKEKEVLEKEKRSLTKLWKEREKRIEMLQHNFADIFGSIQGITGDALPEPEIFKLPGNEDK